MTNEEAIEVLQNELDGIPFDLDKSDFEQALEIAIKAIRNEPIDDLSEYSDKLWKLAYERGKAEGRPQGEWEDYNGDFYKCPECGYLLNKLCPRCHNKVILPKDGADMRVKNELNNELKGV